MLGRTKWISLLLVFTMLFVYIAPQASMAATSNVSSVSAAPSPSTVMHKDVKRLGEIVSKRAQYSKTYLNSEEATQ